MTGESKIKRSAFFCLSLLITSLPHSSRDHYGQWLRMIMCWIILKSTWIILELHSPISVFFFPLLYNIFRYLSQLLSSSWITVSPRMTMKFLAMNPEEIITQLQQLSIVLYLNSAFAVPLWSLYIFGFIIPSNLSPSQSFRRNGWWLLNSPSELSLI